MGYFIFFTGIVGACCEINKYAPIAAITIIATIIITTVFEIAFLVLAIYYNSFNTKIFNYENFILYFA